jgi:hypothetical protein
VNDFTKEDLEIIIYLIDAYCEGDDLTKLSYNPFRKKVESMIDNYCDHSWFFYLRNGSSVLRCHKCDKELPDDNQ